jgi:molybdate transport system ATP-binding protein
VLSFERVRLGLDRFVLEIDEELNSGWTGLTGPSGAGKTSLLELAAGLRKPDAGAIRAGSVLLSDSGGIRVPPRRRRIGYVTQDDTLFPHLSVRGNLAFGVRAGRVPPLDFTRVVAVLELSPLLDRRIRSLSGGERRRVALGRALLSGPSMLLLDEPLTGLDEKLRSRILETLAAIRSDWPIPTLYVAHSADEVTRLCDDVLVLVEGRIVRRGAASVVLFASERPIPSPGEAR